MVSIHTHCIDERGPPGSASVSMRLVRTAREVYIGGSRAVEEASLCSPIFAQARFRTMSDQFMAAIANRRTYYGLSKNIPINREKLQELLWCCVR